MPPAVQSLGSVHWLPLSCVVVELGNNVVDEDVAVEDVVRRGRVVEDAVVGGVAVVGGRVVRCCITTSSARVLLLERGRVEVVVASTTTSVNPRADPVRPEFAVRAGMRIPMQTPTTIT